MGLLKIKCKIIFVIGLIVLLSGFTGFTEKVSPPKGVPKRTENRNAGIVIPAFDCTPYDIIEKSYDPLSAFMYDAEKGLFMSLSTSNFDTTSHKLSFHYKNLGFVTYNAHRVSIGFFDKKRMSQFTFSPFEITEPRIASDVIAIAEQWIVFLDSLGWKRKPNPYFPYRNLPQCEAGDRLCSSRETYMEWENDGLEMTISIGANNIYEKNPLIPRYEIKIIFSNMKLIEDVIAGKGSTEDIK